MQFFKVAFFRQTSSIKKIKILLSPTLHPLPLTFRRHSVKRLSPTLPILMKWILLSSPPPVLRHGHPPKKIWNVRQMCGFYYFLSIYTVFDRLSAWSVHVILEPSGALRFERGAHQIVFKNVNTTIFRQE